VLLAVLCKIPKFQVLRTAEHKTVNLSFSVATLKPFLPIHLQDTSSKLHNASKTTQLFVIEVNFSVALPFSLLKLPNVTVEIFKLLIQVLTKTVYQGILGTGDNPKKSCFYG